MDFTRRHKIVKVEDNLMEQYPHALSLYKDPPTGNLLNIFERDIVHPFY